MKKFATFSKIGPRMPWKWVSLDVFNQKFLLMPVTKVPGGWRWGQSGKIYPTKAQAEAQGRAIYASGYREKTTTNKKK